MSGPTPDRLGDALRAHYAGERPRPETLARLVALDALPPARRGRRAAAALAAAAVLGAIAWFVGSGSSEPFTVRVAAEIALNHEKLVGPDVRGAALPELAAALDRLDFTPRAPRRLADADLRFTGARYCSLQGQLAVQLQLEDAAGRRRTLYQTRRSERFAKLAAGRHVVGDTEVALWTEGDVVMGLAAAVVP